MCTRSISSLRSMFLVALVCVAATPGHGETSDLGTLDRAAQAVTATGAVSAGEPADIYRFDLGGESDVDLRLTGLSGNANLQLLSASGQVLASSAKKKKQGESIRKRLAPDEYQAVVRWADSQPVSYTFQAGATFLIDDVIATGKAAVQDPEYDSTAMKAVWRDGTTLRATEIDPDTGLYRMAAQQVIDTGLATATEVINGPEWASVDGGEPRIVYTKSGTAGWSISQAREGSSGGWLTEAVPGTVNGYKPIGSEGGDESSPLMKYTIGTLSVRDQGNAWKELDPPYSGGTLPAGAEAGRFVPGRFSLIYSRDSAGYQQLAWYDLRTGAESLITSTPIHKVLPFAISAPKFGGDTLITTAETANIQERGFFDSIGIYREIDGAWTLIKRITSPSASLRGVHSVEPFVFDGKSYVSFLVLKAVPRETDDDRKANAEVWIASADPGDSFLRKVSGTARIKRSDPESLITGDEVFIYYTEIAKNTYKQHRTRTGLTRR